IRQVYRRRSAPAAHLSYLLVLYSVLTQFLPFLSAAFFPFHPRTWNPYGLDPASPFSSLLFALTVILSVFLHPSSGLSCPALTELPCLCQRKKLPPIRG